jgi:dipeptidyl aminopeptidase/acylaminoacyl peptidase
LIRKSDRQLQLATFEPNYRGSDNMGDQFFASTYKDSGADPGRVVMAGMAMLEARGFIDTTRFAVSGWSSSELR